MKYKMSYSMSKRIKVFEDNNPNISEKDSPGIEDILLAIYRPKGNFKVKDYLFIKERWRAARDAMYYYEGYRRGSLDPKPLPTSVYLFCSSEEMEEIFKKNIKLDICHHAKNNLHAALCDHYIRSYYFDKDKEKYVKSMSDAQAMWRDIVEEEKKKEFIKTWDEGMAFSYPAWTQYAMIALCRGDLAAIENSIKYYMNWYEWRKAQKPKPVYNLVWQRGFTHGYVRPFPVPIGKHNVLLPLLDQWLSARKRGMISDKELNELMKLFYSWYLSAVNDIEYGWLPFLPNQFLLSIVMRIDLDVDLDTCRDFARYFYPYLAVFPHIQDKLKLLNTEYEPAKAVPVEDLRKILTKHGITYEEK